MSLRVDWRSSFSLIGSVVKWLTVPFLVPLAIALVNGRDIVTFSSVAGISLVVGLLMEQLESEPQLNIREGFLMVSGTWLTVAVIGALPYIIAGNGTLATPINALFESMSGFTTTGSTVMANISFETHSTAVMMWRQLSQWLGGMGIVVLAVAILPKLSVGGTQLMAAEAPGPSVDKLAPRIVETARRLWLIYVLLTVVEAVLLYGAHRAGLAPGMGLYNAVGHALTTMPTGGFSPAARSIEAYSATVQWIIIPFMFLAGTNFALLWRAFTGRTKPLLKDPEFRSYIAIILVFTAMLFVVLVLEQGRYLPEAGLRHSLFQTLTIITTTGYASADFAQWSSLSVTILFLAMFIGGCAGSTGGGPKVIRWLVSVKAVFREMYNTIHPKVVKPVRFGQKVIDENNIRQITMLILFYLFLFLVGTFLLEVDAVWFARETKTLDVMSTVAACLGNIGPGFGIVGPMKNFLGYSTFSKSVLIFLMWIGRLEIFTVFVLFLPTYWKN